MHFTLSSFGSTHSMTYLDYGKNGDKYWVTYYDRETGKPAATMEFETAAKAAAVYLKIAGWILLGFYTDEERVRYLTTGTMW